MRKQPASTLTGFQSEDRNLSALPIRIDYQTPLYQHFMRPNADDFLFSFSRQQGQPDFGAPSETTNLDPYAVRRKFEAIGNAEQAVRFLSESGTFWRFEAVSWRQFREWQRFFFYLGWDAARKTPEGERAWATARGFKNTFFSPKEDSDCTRLRFPREAITGIPPADWKKIEVEDRRILSRLRTYALRLGQLTADSGVSIYWYDPAGKKGPPEDWNQRNEQARTSGPLSPWLHIKARNVLEAVAATIYADRAHGIRRDKCKQCGRLFEIMSEHGQKFCPAPAHLNSSPCKNAYTQKLRRKRKKDAATDGEA
jgi:hypothetical protein